jgi:hypothetical protein
MQIRKRNELYSETEVADILDITREQLHELLDRHVFNDGSERPEELTFTSSEVVLLGFWQKGARSADDLNRKVIHMPKRR